MEENKNQNNSSLDIEIFSRFVGLWIMKLDIPKDIFEYVKTHKCPIENVDFNLMIKMIIGSPDQKDSQLRNLILPLI